MADEFESQRESGGPSERRRTVVYGVGCAALLAVTIALAGVYGARRLHPYWCPTEYIPEVEHTAAPTIAAIDAYVDRVGHPPRTLQDLLPEYDAARAGTGYPPQDQFFYKTWRTNQDARKDEWMLVLWAELVALDCDVIEFRSSKRTWEFIVVR